MVFLARSEEHPERKDGIPMDETEKKMVLVVDDDLFVLDMMNDFLSHLGYRVFTASSGAEALAIYEKHQTDVRLVILDLVMPRMNGDEVFEKLRGYNPNARVICNSGYWDPGTVQRMLDDGLWKFLPKPISFPILKSLLHEALAEEPPPAPPG